jgi:hypothetical protein
MAKIIENIKRYWDLATRRYEAFPATNSADIEACVQVLEEVRRKELNRLAGTSVLESHAFAGEKMDFTLMACRDTKTHAIIGCMRITPASYAQSVPASRVEYALDNIPEEHVKSLQIFTRLAVLKPYRKTPAALVLIAESMMHILEAGAKGALISCEPNLYSMYRQLGLRSIGPLHNSPSGGYRIPMIFLPDKEYLESIRSPAMRWGKKFDFRPYDAINQWFRHWWEQNQMSHPGITLLQDAKVDAKVHHVLTRGLSEAGCQAFLKNALVIQCQENDVLVAEEDGGKGLGIILSGMVKVVIDGKSHVKLQPGALFGEIAFVLDTRRTASLIAAAPDTRILLFSTSAYQRLEQASDKITLWRNLAQVLAQRVLVADRLLT